MCSWDGLGLRSAVPIERCPDAAKCCKGTIVAESKPDDVFLLCFGVRLWRVFREKLLNGTKQRFSGFSQLRQCGDDVLRILVTGGPPVRSGGGIPHRIIASKCKLRRGVTTERDFNTRRFVADYAQRVGYASHKPHPKTPGIDWAAQGLFSADHSFCL
jgi:hypothetical protein